LETYFDADETDANILVLKEKAKDAAKETETFLRG